MGNGGTTHYLLKEQWQTMYLRKSEKWKITFLSLIRLSCQTFMGQTENKGRGIRLLTQWSAAAVTGYRLGRVPKENQALCLQELLISELPRGPFKRATDYVSPCFVCGFVCIIWMLEPISITKKSALQEFSLQYQISIIGKRKNWHLVIHWLQAKFKCWSIAFNQLRHIWFWHHDVIMSLYDCMS